MDMELVRYLSVLGMVVFAFVIGHGYGVERQKEKQRKARVRRGTALANLKEKLEERESDG